MPSADLAPAGQAGELVSSRGATFFDPGHGRTGKMRVAVFASDRWPDLARDARAFAAG